MLKNALLTLCFIFAACGRTDPLSPLEPDEPAPIATIEDNLLARWNASADKISHHPELEFHWRELAKFPHPTYRTGSRDAYNKSAELLARFYSAGDNLEFLKRHHLLDRRFTTDLPATVITFRSFTLALVNGAMIDSDHRAALEKYCRELGC